MLYNTLPHALQAQFATSFARMFWNNPDRIQGTWEARVWRHRISVPIRPDTINLDWIYAQSIATHDVEVTETYRNFLDSGQRPDIFLDIGANFGMHSLIMAKAGLRVLSFEPNPFCVDYASAIYRVNGVSPIVSQSAIGASPGTLVLTFPKRETWLGTTVGSVAASLVHKEDLTSVEVEVRPLDAIAIERGRLLIKVDVEGAELSVFQGAVNTLLSREPAIVFESNDLTQKAELQHFFTDLGWSIYGLPFDPDERPSSSIDLSRTGDDQTNFIAMPPTMQDG